jgi:hypothetical protein
MMPGLHQFLQLPEKLSFETLAHDAIVKEQ